MSTTIYLPTSNAVHETISLAPSPPAIAGLRIAVLDNGKPNAGVVMSRAASSLASAANANVSLVTKKGPGGRSANAAIPCAPDIIERLVAEADVVITGAADCGSCTAYSVHDAIELERLGRPTVVVTTTKFRPIAETMATNFGLPDVRLLVLPHPLGGTARGTLHQWADDAVDALLALWRLTRTRVIERRDSAGDPLSSALAEMRSIVQADGGDLRIDRHDRQTGTVTLELLIDDASCAECVMPAEHLEQAALSALQRAIPDVKQVTIDDPRRV